MPKIKRRQYDDAYKREAVELVLSGDRSTSEVARSLDLATRAFGTSSSPY